MLREEIFGPVLVAIRWNDEAEVIRMANHTHYDLAAFVWPRDETRSLRTAHAVEAGWVQVNRGIGQILKQSYGGVKLKQHRPGVLARRHARQLHHPRERHREPGHSGRARLLSRAGRLPSERGFHGGSEGASSLREPW